MSAEHERAMFGRRDALGLLAAAAGTPLVGAMPALAAPPSRGSADAIEAAIVPSKGADLKPRTLVARMKELGVPGVGIAFFQDGKVDWVKSYGLADVATGRTLTDDALFQAASVSKPVAAVTALRLVEMRRLGLDADLRRDLRSFGIGDGAAGPDDRVTLRQLLSHSAGLNIGGFIGYFRDAVLPTSVETLSGGRTANNPPVRFVRRPGSAWSYSGGGFTAVEALIEARMRASFGEVARRLVLRPCGMSASRFDQPLEAGLDPRIAMPHDSQGKAQMLGPRAHPELAAAGLWTTPAELARFGIAVIDAHAGRSSRLLGQGMTRQMLTRQAGFSGLGFNVNGAERSLQISHRGANAGYRCGIMMMPALGQGVAIMTNGDGGGSLVEEIMKAVGTAYGWPAPPEPKPTDLAQNAPPMAPVAIPAEALAPYVGIYQIPGATRISTVIADGQLILNSSGGGFPPSFPLVATGPDRFMPPPPFPGEFLFVRNGAGDIEKLVVNDWVQAFRT